MRTALVLLLVIGGLAGCVDEPLATDGDTPGQITDPTDFSYLQNQAAGFHVHDYWGGQDELLVIEETRRAGILFGGGTFSTAFLPATDEVIPLGTSEVHVTVDWAPTGHTGAGDPIPWPQLHGEPYLAVKTAADESWEPFAEITKGDTIVFPSSNEQNDLPHQRISNWEFGVIWPPWQEETGRSSWRYEVSMTVKAVRGLDIPPFPPHPDLWQGRDSFDLSFDEVSFDVYYGTPPGFEFCQSCDDYEYRPFDGVIVPWNASHVEVIMTFSQDAQGRFDLAYHGADSMEYTVLEPSAVEEGRIYHYEIPVDGNGDSPYGLQSQWRFALHSDQDTLFDGGIRIESYVHRNPA